MSRRKERHVQFRTLVTGGTATLSPHLLECALSLLQLALKDRHGEVTRLHDNHFSDHAVGSIVLLVDALEA